MRTKNHVIAILENEAECVRRADKGLCDRDCERCELVRPTDEILDSYQIAIEAVKEMRLP